MKIILTGSTSPIGSVVLEHLNKEHEVTIISKANNWDLTDPIRIKDLIDLTEENDVFINLAHINFIQGLLLGDSRSKINISFTSLITQFEWSLMQNFNKPEYISQKLFLEYVHKERKDSALISISSYGKGAIPSVTDEQIFNAIDDVIKGRSILPTRIEVSNGLGDLSQVLS
jgi:hypothetical protein